MGTTSPPHRGIELVTTHGTLEKSLPIVNTGREEGEGNDLGLSEAGMVE